MDFCEANAKSRATQYILNCCWEIALEWMREKKKDWRINWNAVHNSIETKHPWIWRRFFLFRKWSAPFWGARERIWSFTFDSDKIKIRNAQKQQQQQQHQRKSKTTQLDRSSSTINYKVVGIQQNEVRMLYNLHHANKFMDRNNFWLRFFFFLFSLTQHSFTRTHTVFVENDFVVICEQKQQRKKQRRRSI